MDLGWFADREDRGERLFLVSGSTATRKRCISERQFTCDRSLFAAPLGSYRSSRFSSALAEIFAVPCHLLGFNAPA